MSGAKIVCRENLLYSFLAYRSLLGSGFLFRFVTRLEFLSLFGSNIFIGLCKGYHAELCVRADAELRGGDDMGLYRGDGRAALDSILISDPLFNPVFRVLYPNFHPTF